MKLHYAVGALALLGSLGAQAALPPPAVIPFDAAYMVDAPTSVIEIDEFALGGPPPTLFVDLPGSSLFTFLDSKWFFDGVLQFTLLPTNFLNDDLFWMRPGEAEWAAKQALGVWRVDTRYSFGDILFAENGGIGVGFTSATGSASVNFTVTPAPVPLPGALAPFALAIVLLGRRTR